MSQPFLIYGCTGYTARLVIRFALEQGMRPVLAGRSPEGVGAVAREFGLEHRVFGLEDPKALDEGLRGMKAVLHCAGPFAHTFRQMADACVRTGTHYLDITGEIAVFEGLAARDGEARGAGITFLPGVGFDVVPSDCLAAHLKRRLPSATHLSLGFRAKGRMSRGTANTTVENIASGGAVRRGGRIVKVPVGRFARTIDYGDGPRHSVAIPWGDVSTAWYSTGIPDIEVYVPMPRSARWMALLSRPVAPLMGTRPVQRLLKSRIQAGPPGPTDEERATGSVLLWGEVTDADGRRAVSRLRTPEGYTLTALAALEATRRVLAGEAPAGFQTPSRAFGADFVMQFEGVERIDLE